MNYIDNFLPTFSDMFLRVKTCDIREFRPLRWDRVLSGKINAANLLPHVVKYTGLSINPSETLLTNSSNILCRDLYKVRRVALPANFKGFLADVRALEFLEMLEIYS